jgi:dienelactone hydrolase
MIAELLLLTHLTALVHAQQLVVSASAPLDEPTSIRAVGLPQGARVSIRVSVTDDDGIQWRSQASYRADSLGEVDISRHVPFASSHAMGAGEGLFTLMTPSDSTGPPRRFARRSLEPVRTSISLIDSTGAVKDSALVERYFVAMGTRVRDVNANGIRGRLFIPPPRPRAVPGLLVLGGSEGGYSDHVAALLANRGFAALSLAYFGVDSLPTQLAEIPLEYFTKALTWLAAQPEVSREALGVVGTSKGAEAALIVASRTPLVRAVVAYAPSAVAWSCICANRSLPSWTAAGTPIPSVPFAADPSYAPAPGEPSRPGVNFAYRLRTAPSQAFIPVERIAGPILLIAGEDDQLWPSAAMARDVLARRRTRGGHPNDSLLLFAGAGHLIGKVYLPAGSTLIAGGRLETGGTAAGNARAQGEAWREVVRFLSEALRMP